MRRGIKGEIFESKEGKYDGEKLKKRIRLQIHYITKMMTEFEEREGGKKYYNKVIAAKSSLFVFSCNLCQLKFILLLLRFVHLFDTLSFRSRKKERKISRLTSV